MARKPRKKSAGQVSSLVGANITQATGWLGGEVSGERARNLDYYYGRRLSRDDASDAEIEDGLSRWISTDVQDTIEAMMPDLMEIFASSDQIFAFEPTRQEHEEFSEQATDYVNYVLWNDNPGYDLIHDFFKDCLLQKNGYVKCLWDKAPKVEQETMTGVSSPVLAMYDMADDIEIVAVEANEAPPMSEMLYPDGIMWDVTIKRTFQGQVDINGVAPENMLTSRYARSLDEKILFVADFQEMPRSDLIENGYDPKIVDRLPTSGSEQPRATREQFARWRDEDNYGTGWTDESGAARDRSMETVRVYDCYVLMDYLGTGVAQRYNVKCGGSGESPTILPDPETDEIAVEVDCHPYVEMTPIRMPHKMIGRAVADLVVDIQDIKSTGGREMLNEMYYANNQRVALGNKANLADYLTNRPGGAVRIDTDNADVGGHIQPIPTGNGVGRVAMPLMQYMDDVKQKRTGESRSNSLDPEALHKTATGANLMLGESQKRLLFIARTCAETGIKGLARKLLRIVVNNQDFERTVQLRGKWVTVRPDRWNADMNVSVTVGLGHGTRAQKIIGIEQILEKQAVIIQQQGGLSGPFVTAENIGNSLEEYVNAHGYKDASMFFNVDIENLQAMAAQGQDEGPDAATILAQAEMLKAQADLLKAQNDRAKLMVEAQQKQADTMLEYRDSEADRQIDMLQHGDNMEYKYTELAAKTGTEMEKIMVDAEKASAALDVDVFRQIGWGGGNVGNA